MERLFDVKQTAEILGIKPVTLRLWISLKKIPYYKIGKCVKFKPAEIEAWIDATRVGPDPNQVDKKVAELAGIRYEKGCRHSDRNQSREGGV